MELIIPLLVLLFLAGSISFLRPSKKMKFLAELRLSALKLGFKIDSSNAMKGMFKNDQSDLVSYQLRNTTFIKQGQFVREGDAMNLYDPASLKFDQNFQKSMLEYPNSAVLDNMVNALIGEIRQGNEASQNLHPLLLQLWHQNLNVDQDTPSIIRGHYETSQEGLSHFIHKITLPPTKEIVKGSGQPHYHS